MGMTVKELTALRETEQARDILVSELDRVRGVNRQLHNDISTLNRDLAVAHREIERSHDHALVLQSDRDRLTVALEVCTRRLGSPVADSDWTRGGWRSANRMMPNAQKPETPLPTEREANKSYLT